MPLPITHKEQHLYNEVQARFCCPERQTFTDAFELGCCFGLWVILARILNQPHPACHKARLPISVTDYMDPRTKRESRVLGWIGRVWLWRSSWVPLIEARTNHLMREPATSPKLRQHRVSTRINPCIYLVQANPPDLRFMRAVAA